MPSDVPSPTRFIVYADESGDHGLSSIDPDYPVFVLAFCVFRQSEYTTRVSPEFQRLKFKYLGHDTVVFHEREIRKKLGPFSILKHPPLQEAFMSDLEQLVTDAPVTIIAAVIDKTRLKGEYGHRANNPYDLAMGFCLERLHWFLCDHEADAEATRIVFECRGAVEDRELELEFRRVCAGQNALDRGLGRRLPFEIVFADKRVNSSGLQVADLVARPIARHVLNPAAPNRPWAILCKKIRSRKGSIEGAGLKVFP